VLNDIATAAFTFAVFAFIVLFTCHEMRTRRDVLKIKLLRRTAQVPKRGNDFAAGIDLFLTEVGIIAPGETLLLKTGVAAEIPPGMFGMIRGRSSSLKHGLFIQGTIDSDYRGEIMIIVTNVGKNPVSFKAGQALAQMIMMRYEPLPITAVQALGDTERGDQGFGSTGNAVTGVHGVAL
jgi:dUTP pyrophosphatase